MATEPITHLRGLILNEVPRERVARPNEDGSKIQLVEKQSLSMFEITEKDAVDMVVSCLEQSIVDETTIAEVGSQPLEPIDEYPPSLDE
jgi:hypothetical protein